MRTSQKIAIWAAALNIVAVIAGIALYNPLSHITIGQMPVMIYVLLLIAALTIVGGYALIPRIEALEEKGD